MKQTLQKIVLKIDSLSLRERAIIFGLIAVLLLTGVNLLVLDPKFAKQKQLSEQVRAEQAQIDQIRTEIHQTVRATSDPDVNERVRLGALQQQLTQMRSTLLDMQKGLVPPDKMTVLLEDILKRNGRLRLVSLKTLPVTGLNDAIPVDATPAEKTGVAVPVGKSVTAQPVGAVYRHGVELTVQGSYLEMMEYMTELESMPWQLFWGKAKLNVDEYPKATLALTLFTLSLDKKWLNL
jgi:MSHA biogenesis protein MshJ